MIRRFSDSYGYIISFRPANNSSGYEFKGGSSEIWTMGSYNTYTEAITIAIGTGYKEIFDLPENISLPNQPPKWCTCGSASCGSDRHSHWCDLGAE